MDGLTKRLLSSVTLLVVLLVVVLAGCGLFGGSSSDGDKGKTPAALKKIKKKLAASPELKKELLADLSSEFVLTAPERSQEKAFAGLRWMLYAGIGLAGIGIALLFVPLPGLRSWSVPCLASGGFISFIAITLNQHYLLISWIGLGIGLAGIGLLGWMLWKNKGHLAKVGTSLLQIITGNEQAKKVLPVTVKTKIYGSDEPDDHGIMGEYQSDETEAIVAKMRALDEDSK